MSDRKRISTEAETAVLTKSLRRCCVCFALHKDFEVKDGQIAHLDQNPRNSQEHNLAWLCFEHHNQYDSTTSQSKNLTRSELLVYRNSLYIRNDMSAEHVLVDITIETDFDAFSDEDQNRFLGVVSELLKLGGNVSVIQRRRGSVILRIEITEEQAKALKAACENQRLAEYNVSSVDIVNDHTLTETTEIRVDVTSHSLAASVAPFTVGTATKTVRVLLSIAGRPQLAIASERITIGSDPSCDVSFPDSKGVFPRHAIIRKHVNRWVVQAHEADTIFVPGLHPTRVHWLEQGDEIRLTREGPSIVFNVEDEDLRAESLLPDFRKSLGVAGDWIQETHSSIQAETSPSLPAIPGAGRESAPPARSIPTGSAITLTFSGHRPLAYDLEQITIGSDPNCNVTLSGFRGILPRHAVISRIHGRWLIEAVGPKNHLYFDTERSNSFWLIDGCTIRLTSTGPAVVVRISGSSSLPSR